MIQTLSYSAEIKHADKIFSKTIDLYQSAVKFCIKVFEAEWSDISAIDAKNRGRFSFANKLIHSNKNNSAKYQEFDKLFYKMPSYVPGILSGKSEKPLLKRSGPALRQKFLNVR